MKNLLLIAFCLCSYISLSQNKNFVIENGLVYWKNIYETPIKLETIKTNPRLDFTTDSTGVLKKGLPHKKYKEEIKAEFKIEKKDNKYRVSVFNIRFIDSFEITLYGVTNKSEDTSIETYLIRSKDGEIRKNKKAIEMLDLLNDYLINIFDSNKEKKKDW